MRPRYPRFWFVFFLSVGGVSCSEGPSRSRAGDFELTPLVILGDSADGIIDQNVTIAEWRGQYAVSHMSSPAQVQLFDSEGHFLKVIGQEGQGPQEFRSIRALLAAPSGELVVVDGGNGRVARLSADGEVLETFPIDWRGRPFIGGFDLFPNGDLLVNGMARGAGSDSHILRWDWEEPIWSITEPESIGEDGLREAAIDDDGSVWVVRARHEFRIEHYSPSGALLKTFRPSRPWFDDWKEQEPEVPGTDAHSGFWGPMAWVRDVAVQGDELWVLAVTGDPRWREARSSGGIDMGLFGDSVIDVYDKHTGELIASGQFDLPREYLIAFLGKGKVVGHHAGELLDHLVVREIGRR